MPRPCLRPGTHRRPVSISIDPETLSFVKRAPNVSRLFEGSVDMVVAMKYLLANYRSNKITAERFFDEVHRRVVVWRSLVPDGEAGEPYGVATIPR